MIYMIRDMLTLKKKNRARLAELRSVNYLYRIKEIYIIRCSYDQRG